VNRLRDVFDTLLPDVFQGIREPVADMVAHRARDADPAGFRYRLQPCRDVDAVAVNVVVIRNDISEIDPDTEGYVLVLGYRRIAVDHSALHLDGAAHRIDDARKFHQHAVAGSLNDPPAMLPYLRIDEFSAVRLQRVKGALFISSHEA
jgi:hypothetical protein